MVMWVFPTYTTTVEKGKTHLRAGMDNGCQIVKRTS